MLLSVAIVFAILFAGPSALSATFPPHILFINHVHTLHSRDAAKKKTSKSPEFIYQAITEFLEKRGVYGAVAFTDHNRDRALQSLIDNGYRYEFPNHQRLSVIRGMEWGASTHVGILGMTEGWQKLSPKPMPTRAKQIKLAKPSGGLRVVNHPGQPYAAWLPGDWADAEAVEILNQPYGFRPMIFFPNTSVNALARLYWIYSLKEGKRHTALGGSDFHFEIDCFLDHMLHYPLNVVFAPSNDPATVLAAIKDGQVSVLGAPDAPKIAIETEHAFMGGTAPAGRLKLKIFLDFQDAQEELRPACYSRWKELFDSLQVASMDRYVVKLFTKSGNRAFSVEPKGVQELLTTVDLGASDYVRAEVWRTNPLNTRSEVLSYSNPIYTR